MPPLPIYAESNDAAPAAAAGPGQLVERFFRHEAGRLHGALLRRFGVHHLGLVEDAVQEAMLRALRSWSMGGVPPNPSAWISRVAINHAHDTLRRRGTALTKRDAVTLHHEMQQSVEPAADPLEDEIDDTLQLLLVCCHPSIPSDAQVVLALKVLGGFNLGEIARAFLSTEGAIEKQLTRTKARLRDAGATFALPPEGELTDRIEGALATLYLLFNEGYKATTGDQLLREDLCNEALRLAGLLVRHPVGNQPATHALLALMLLHSARFPARTNPTGGLLRLADQDRSIWDQSRIDLGLQHLAIASQGNHCTTYHLQAGIAAHHCLAPDVGSTDWGQIVGLYDELMHRSSSPVIALNRAVAIANLSGPRAGLDALNAIEDAHRLASQHLVYAVSGDLHSRLGDHVAAATAFRRALQLVKLGPEQAHLTRLLEHIENQRA